MDLELQETDEPQEYVTDLCGKEVLQLKGNSIPMGLVPLITLFNPNDVAKEPQLVPICEYVEDVNIGTEEHPSKYQGTSHQRPRKITFP